MSISRTVKNILAAIVLFVAVVVLVFWLSLPRLTTWVIGFHQQGVTRSLAVWAEGAANITNDVSAIHAAEMLKYMSYYYVPGAAGYRGSAEVEAALQLQRRKSIESVATSLERYTGLDYGANVGLWTEWAKERKSSAQDAELKDQRKSE